MVSKLDTGRCANEDVGFSREGAMDCEIPYRLERDISFKVVETSPRFKTVRLTTIRNELKWTIYASSRLGLFKLLHN